MQKWKQILRDCSSSHNHLNLNCRETAIIYILDYDAMEHLSVALGVLSIAACVVLPVH